MAVAEDQIAFGIRLGRSGTERRRRKSLISILTTTVRAQLMERGCIPLAEYVPFGLGKHPATGLRVDLLGITVEHDHKARWDN